MSQQWLEGSEIRQRHDGLSMVGGPPRVVHHITYDSLRSSVAIADRPAATRYSDGGLELHDAVHSCIPGLDEWMAEQEQQSVRGERVITLDGVTNYLLDRHYEPHLVIDPFDGRAISCLPADEGGFALLSGNRTGDVCYQIEWFFTPGTVYDGVRYDQLFDTPMGGLDRVMALADSWDIPRVAPLSPGDRNSNVWNNVAGHYGHFNVPGNDHSDPVCTIQSILDRAEQPIRIPEDDDMAFRYSQGGHVWVTDGISRRRVIDPRTNDALQNTGKCPAIDHPDVDGLHYQLFDFDGAMHWFGEAARLVYGDHGMAIMTEAQRLAMVHTSALGPTKDDGES